MADRKPTLQHHAEPRRAPARSGEHEEHKSLYRLFPSQPLDVFVRVAANGAHYHFEKLKECLQTRGMQTLWEEDASLDENTRQALQADVNRFHWHLRGVFWELVATFDTLLQWANQKLGLGVAEGKVTWRTVERKLRSSTGPESTKVRRLLQEMWDSEWYFEVRKYRNFAHRGFLLNTSGHDVGRGEMIHVSLLPVRQGQEDFTPLLDQLGSYGNKLREVVETLLRA